MKTEALWTRLWKLPSSDASCWLQGTIKRDNPDNPTIFSGSVNKFYAMHWIVHSKKSYFSYVQLYFQKRSVQQIFNLSFYFILNALDTIFNA
jgi:hypothetical protein